MRNVCSVLSFMCLVHQYSEIRDLISCPPALSVLDPTVGHTMDVLSPFVPVLCHSD